MQIDKGKGIQGVTQDETVRSDLSGTVYRLRVREVADLGAT